MTFQGVLVEGNVDAGDRLFSSNIGNLPIFGCPCTSNQLTEFDYFANQVSPVVQQQNPNFGQYLLRCEMFNNGARTVSSPCVCDESGNCFTPFGTLQQDPAGPAGNPDDNNAWTFLLFPFCDTGMGYG